MSSRRLEPAGRDPQAPGKLAIKHLPRLVVDGPNRELGISRRPHFSHRRDPEREPQRRRDLGRHHHAAAGDTEDDRGRRVAIGREPAGEALGRISPISERHRADYSGGDARADAECR